MTRPLIDGDTLLTVCATPAYHDDPYPFLARLRPVDRVKNGPWLVSGYEDVSRLLRDPRLGNDPRGGDPAAAAAVRGTRGADDQAMPPPVTALDPPDHARVRDVLGAVLPARLVTHLGPRVCQVADELLDQLAPGGGGVDLIERFAAPLPVRIAGDLFGLPAGDRDRVVAWGTRLAVNGDPDPVVRAPDRAAAAAAERDLARYFAQLVLRRRRAGGDDLISALAAAGGPLSFPELVVNAVFLFVNSYHNTVSLIGNAVLALLRHPEQWDRLRSDPTLAPAAVEEALRYDSPIQSIARTTREPVDVAGVTIPAGHQVMALVGAAHRDATAFDEPDMFRLTGRTRRALSFGAGPHYCVGAGLARLQAETALSRLAARLPGLSLATRARRSGTLTLRGVTALPVHIG
ncbi:cytochrome P450 [Luedemannella helvata]|uniref:cytochrome P450 n=1 Tax=Luedemannella helvata TaxID=349315 RepID=UPI0031D0272E